MIIKKEFTIDLAHRLQQHEWKCFNVHWHTYKIILFIKGEQKTEWPEIWMVMDFWNTKYIKDWFNENRDHSYLYNKWDEIWEFIKSKWMRVWECDFELTAENMCKFILKQFPELYGVEVFETPTSSALLFND